MDLRKLQHFTRVAELGSFSRAAELLGIGQPVLSRDVRALEVEFRQVLLKRNGRGVTLTDAGEQLLRHSRSLFQHLDQVQSEMLDSRTGTHGRFTIALPPSISGELSVQLVRRVRDGLPGLQLCILEGLSAYAIEWVSNGRADCAVCYSTPTSLAIERVPLVTEPLYMVSSAAFAIKHGLSPDSGQHLELHDLAGYRLIMPSHPHAVRAQLSDHLAQRSLRLQVALEVESVPAILELIQDGEYCAVLPLEAVRTAPRLQGMSRFPIGSPPITTTLWLATSAYRPPKACFKHLQPMIKDLVTQMWASQAPRSVAGGDGKDRVLGPDSWR